MTASALTSGFATYMNSRRHAEQANADASPADKYCHRADAARAAVRRHHSPQIIKRTITGNLLYNMEQTCCHCIWKVACRLVQITVLKTNYTALLHRLGCEHTTTLVLYALRLGLSVTAGPARIPAGLGGTVHSGFTLPALDSSATHLHTIRLCIFLFTLPPLLNSIFVSQSLQPVSFLHFLLSLGYIFRTTQDTGACTDKRTSTSVHLHYHLPTPVYLHQTLGLGANAMNLRAFLAPARFFYVCHLHKQDTTHCMHNNSATCIYTCKPAGTALHCSFCERLEHLPLLTSLVARTHPGPGTHLNTAPAFRLGLTAPPQPQYLYCLPHWVLPTRLWDPLYLPHLCTSPACCHSLVGCLVYCRRRFILWDASNTSAAPSIVIVISAHLRYTSYCHFHGMPLHLPHCRILSLPPPFLVLRISISCIFSLPLHFTGRCLFLCIWDLVFLRLLSLWTLPSCDSKGSLLAVHVLRTPALSLHYSASSTPRLRHK